MDFPSGWISFEVSRETSCFGSPFSGWGNSSIPMVGIRKNVSSSLLFLTSKKWLCVLMPWEAEPHFPTTEWASLLHVFVGVSRETWWVGDGFGVWLPSPTSCCEDWCFTWNHSANGKHPSRRPTMFHVKHRHFHKQYSPCLQSCFMESVSAAPHV